MVRYILFYIWLFSFVLSLISTVCELFFTKEVPCFTLQNIFISSKVLVLAFLSHLSNLWLDIFCSRYGFFHLFCLWFQLFVNYSLLKKCLVLHCKIFPFHNEWIVFWLFTDVDYFSCAKCSYHVLIIFQNFNIAFDYLLMLTIFHVPKFL